VQELFSAIDRSTNGGFWGSDASAAKGRFEPKLPSGTEKSFAGASLQACVISDAT
jgi:hypothetical protein